MHKIILLFVTLLLLGGCFSTYEEPTCPIQPTSFETCYEYCRVITGIEKQDKADEEFRSLKDECVDKYWEKLSSPAEVFNLCDRRYGLEELQVISNKWDHDYELKCLELCAGGE